MDANFFYYSTVETRYNAVLGVHRSDPRYIRVDRYNAVCPVFPPPPPPPFIRGRSSHIMNVFTT